ncbi:MAG: hypothetical protein KC493_17460 [Bacteriovoracaceae bacterium]|nr:hypothetical protein [Bacteriovoracaceae bacterium]
MTKNEEGQSTVEFIISFMMVIGFVFLYVKMALNFTNGYVVHYANFMASRALLVQEANSNQVDGSDTKSRQVAEEVWNGFNVEDVLGGIEITKDFNMPGAVDNNLFVGTIVEYEDRFSIFGNVGTTDKLKFKSESFLGKEPTIAECVERICEAFRALGAGGCNHNTTVMDNGC